MNWIESEFRRTRLPKLALARYLERQKPVISLIANGDRQVSSEEADLIKAFFSVVPPTVNAQFSAAVETLTSKKLRTRVGIDLYRHFCRRAEHGYDELRWSLATLLEPLSKKKLILRADQIVAICRMSGLDLGAFTDGSASGEPGERHRATSKDAIAELNSAARQWMTESGAPRPYEFDRGGRFEPIIDRSKGLSAATLEIAGNYRAEFGECTGFQVADNNAKPFFEKGQTIFTSNTKPRPGDLVVIMLKEPTASPTSAIIGKLTIDSLETVTVERSNGTQKLQKSRDIEVKRIDYCRL